MIYIISDIHGLYSRYEKLLKRIKFSDDDFLYVLGDVIDRGSDGLKILFDLMKRDNVQLFLGNHEHMMLTYLEGLDKTTWFYKENGGKVTYGQFKSLDETKQNQIVEYLHDSCIVKNLKIGERKYILSHTSVWIEGNDLYTKDYLDKLMDIQALVWDMYPYDVEYLPHYDKCEEPTTLVSGHIITRNLHNSDEVFIKEYKNGYTWIDIDCGCAMGEHFGYLSCLAIDETGEIVNIYYQN